MAATANDSSAKGSMPAIVAVLMGVVTAAFGGVLRDIVVNEIPRAFKDRQPYAVCAFVGGWVVVGAQAAGLHDGWCLLIGAAVGILMEKLWPKSPSGA